MLEMFETYTQIKTIEVPIKMHRPPIFESMMHQESYSNNFYEQKKIKISNFMQQDYAEVEFQNLQDAEQAFLRFNGAQLDGQVLKLKFYPIRIDRVKLEEEFKQKYNITEEKIKEQQQVKDINHKEISRESRVGKADSRDRSRCRGRDRKRSHSRDYKRRSPARNGRYRRNSPVRRPQRGKYQSYRGDTRRDRSYSRNRDRRGRYNNHRDAMFIALIIFEVVGEDRVQDLHLQAVGAEVRQEVVQDHIHLPHLILKKVPVANHTHPHHHPDQDQQANTLVKENQDPLLKNLNLDRNLRVRNEYHANIRKYLIISLISQSQLLKYYIYTQNKKNNMTNSNISTR